MVLRTLGGALLSAVIFMVWGFLFWAILESPQGVLDPVPNEAGVMQVLKESLPATGSYFFPSHPGEEPGTDHAAEFEIYMTRHRAGPIGLIHFRGSGVDPLSPDVYLFGFLHFFVSSLIAAFLLVLAIPIFDTYVHRVIFLTGLGIFGVVAVKFTEPIWWRLPWAFHLHVALFLVVGWFLSALVMAWIIRPERGYTHATDPNKPLWKRALDVD